MKRWCLLGGGLLLAAAVLLGAVIFLNAAPKNSVEMKVRAAVLEQAESRKHQDAAQDMRPLVLRNRKPMKVRWILIPCGR